MGRARFVNFVVSCAVCDPFFVSTREGRFYVLPPSKEPTNGVRTGIHRMYSTNDCLCGVIGMMNTRGSDQNLRH